MEEQLQQFYSQLPPELQEKIQMLSPEKQQEVLMELLTKYNNSQQNVDNSQQFALGGKPKSNYDLVQDSLANFMYSPDGKFFSNRQQYQDYQDFYYPKPVEDNVNQPIVNNYYIKKYKPRFINRFEEGGQTQGIPVEAERNETLTIQDGQQPQVEGGYLEQQSYNPITGQSTYEIPDNKHNATHDNGGVNMKLSQGDVVNSDKTKIPTDFKVYGKNFKGKTFKEASDYLAKQETKIQDDFATNVEEGKTDKVSDGALQIMLAKLGKNRDELNELQEQVLESKKQKETNEAIKSGLAEYGKVVLEMDKAEHGFNASLDRYLNYKVTDRPVLKAAEGLTASLEKFSKFADKVTSNPNSSLQDIMSAYKQSGLGNAPSFNHNSKTPVSFDYKPKNVTIPKQEIFSSIHSASNKYGIDPALMFTMADIESSFNPNATSKTGAAGLFQFTKGTGKQYGLEGEKRYDLKANADAGARLLLDNQKILIKNGIEPTPVYIYLAHQLGAGGAIELYNSITKGTPISNTTKSNMGLNFGKKSAEQYLAETTKKVMSRYDGYAIKLQEKDAALSLDAHQIKQQYQLPYQPKEIKSDLYNFGIKGITERLKANTYKPTIPDNLQSNSNFAYGGKIYAPEGVTLPKLGHAAINQFENTKGNTQGQSMQMGDNYSQSAEPEILKFITDNIGEDTWNKMPPELQTQVYSFAFNSKQDDRVFKGLATAINPNEVYKGQKDLDVARQNLDPARAIQMIKGADFSDPSIYKNYIDQVLPQQYQSIADNYKGGFDKGQAIYNATWKNRAKDIDKIYKDLVQLSQQNSTPILKKQDEKLKNPFKFSTWQGDKSGINKADYTPEDLQYIAKTYFPGKQFKSNKELQEAIVLYLQDNFGGYEEYVKPITPYANTKSPLPNALYDDKFGDDWNLAIAKMKEGIIQPISPLGLQKLNVTTNSNYDLPSDIASNFTLNKSRVNSHVPLKEKKRSAATPTPGQNNQSKKASWLDKLKYGIRESLPYLRNMMLMNEGIINPVLQQKSYQNPYDNFNTDYSIQSALNDSDRSTLTAMADERGNPSVRSARLAQIAANAIAAKAPLYTQKYNQEQQLQNQKVVGQSQYLNQWEDVNRGLKKQFEHEVLQTREVARQQKNMAIDNMMNDYLRKQEQNQALKLSLLNTNYDWNPYTGKYKFNKEKAAQNFAEKKFLAKNSSSSDNSKIIEGADGESYEVITPKSGKPIIRKIEKKYGGKVVKY